MTDDEELDIQKEEAEPDNVELRRILAAECRSLIEWIRVAGDEDVSEELGSFIHVRKGKAELSELTAVVDRALKASQEAGDSRQVALALVADAVAAIKLDLESPSSGVALHGVIWCDRDGPEPFGRTVKPDDAVIGFLAIDYLERAVRQLGHIEAIKPTPSTSDDKTAPKRPPREAFQAWTLYGVCQSQRKIAEVLWGDAQKQYKVSRYVQAVKDYLEAGGIPPDISDVKRKAAGHVTTDPDRIEMGQRQDSLTPRQRQPRDPNSDSDNGT